MSAYHFNGLIVFAISLCTCCLILIRWFYTKGWTNMKKKGYTLYLRIAVVGAVTAFMAGSILGILWKFVDNRVPITFSGLLFSLGMVGIAYFESMKTGRFYPSKEFMLQLAGAIITCIFSTLLLYIDFFG